MIKKRMGAGLTVAVSIALFAGGCGGSGSTGDGDKSSGGSKSLEVFSWWTSGSESEALQVLQSAFTTAAPGVTFNNAAVSGGGGSNARTVLATRLQGGNPPDSWQLHPDQDLMSAVEDGSVADISDLYTSNGWDTKLPDTVKAMLQKDGKYYAVPVNAHRANVLWTNPAVLKRAGVELTDTSTPADFVADLPKLKAAGVAPVCLGAKDSFAPAQLLEAFILGGVGVDGWTQLLTGKLSFDDAKVRTAVTQFAETLKYVNVDSAVLTWDQAALQVTDGKCAATLMGDWAFGEYLAKGKKDGTDFSHVIFPGTAGLFDYVGDAFAIPAKNAPNADAEKIWLTQLLKPEVQAQFNLKKGSAPVLAGVSLDGYPDYQKDSAAAFQKLPVVSSLAHAQGAPAEFANTYVDAVTSFLGSKNVDGLLKTMTEAQKTQLNS
ncbi:ABC transporter substrate-binding protein [Actinoplanes sp. NBRC 101535]|uniref:ABC transporter substrate-binding protein n=1 Tax=Actinoplanes sp. NBRC 101535 TaxID=3032196 RepID=UPI00249FA750|nr:ABC transporter substrate-binding protein [Actinoplanes sp. NBRC 101535]GLY02387.1 ABC transporter substrate-binding protein [Actinoplanes sp. NBRC 101535]